MTKRAKKKVYNRSTGQHEPANPTMDTTKWWKKAMGIPTSDEAGSGSLAKRRKATIDSNVRKGGG